MPWKKGESGNYKGRPKKPEIEELRQAIKTVEKSKNKKLLVHFVERAFKSDSVLATIMKKLIADKAQIKGILEGEVNLTIVDLLKNEHRDS